ncbi:AAA-like domain-containing protein [Alkalisalibacterium limincola]|uniref:ATP-binding protein n=1 Tax=Alkalisalibacterium limincola TaxID=2699169 RepID=A0A5C8KYE9_9GAMM|nr:AAA-like domain-containing protein [Alkalisalibacterium limincola]TXK64295.1 hypothetical protein FU658_05160 [Alkalisalibacterium limincola]
MTVVAGPVPVDSDLYIEREFDKKVWGSLTRGESVVLLGPRQHGKTSSLLRLRLRLKEAGFTVALIDLQKLPASYTFRILLEWVANEVASEVGVTSFVKPQGLDAESLHKWFGCVIPDGHSRIAFLIDEASGISDESIRNAFYAQIRAFNAAAKSSPG